MVLLTCTGLHQRGNNARLRIKPRLLKVPSQARLAIHARHRRHTFRRPRHRRPRHARVTAVARHARPPRRSQTRPRQNLRLPRRSLPPPRRHQRSRRDPRRLPRRRCPGLEEEQPRGRSVERAPPPPHARRAPRHDRRHRDPFLPAGFRHRRGGSLLAEDLQNRGARNGSRAASRDRSGRNRKNIVHISCYFLTRPCRETTAASN